MKIIIQERAKVIGSENEWDFDAHEIPAEVTIEDDNVCIVVEGHMYEIPREVFTGIGL